MGTMTKLRTKLRGSAREKRHGHSMPPEDGGDALKLPPRTTSMNATVSVADDVEEVFYAHTAPAGGGGRSTGTHDVVYRTTEQLRGTGLSSLAEDHITDGFSDAPRAPRASGRGLDALRTEVADMRGELQTMRREVMNELHTLRYDVLKEVTVLRGAVAQLSAALADPAAAGATRTAPSPSAPVPPTRAPSADVQRALARTPSVVTSEATRARLTAARPPSASAARGSVRSTQLAPVDDDVLSCPLRPEQLDELFPIVDPRPDATRLARSLAPGTREWALERVQQWLDSRFELGQDPLLAVVGAGGAGKSTFAARVVERFSGGNLLGAHFAKFDRKAKSQPRVALLSLVRQVVANLPGFKRQLARLNLKYVLEEPDAVVLAGKLLVDPLAAMDEPLTPKFLLVDGLDQCRAGALDGAPRNELLALLSQLAPQLPAWLGLLVTSKPMPELARALRVSSVIDFSANNAAFVRDARFLIDEIVDASVSPRDREPARAELERKSGGNLAYLEFTRRALAHPMTAVMNQLEDAGQTGAALAAELQGSRVSLDVLRDLPESLFEIYMEIFEDKFGAGRLRLWRKVQPLLALIVAAAAGPFSLVRERSARELLGYSSDDMRLIRRAFVDIISLRDDGVFRIDSSALFDWLSDPARSHENFFVDARAALPQLKKLQAITSSASSSPSSSSSSSSAGSRRTDSVRSSGRFEPPANPSRPVGILKRGSRA